MEQKKSQIRKESVFCLGFFIEKADERKSGFKPADQDEGGKLYCDLRMEGVAALLRIGFAKKVVVLGGNEKRITTTNIRRGRAIQKMLIDDFGADPDRVEAIDCSPNTAGNVASIIDYINMYQMSGQTFAVVSNMYHIPRVALLLESANVHLPLYPAEAFLLIENEEKWKSELIERYGGGSLAKRIVEEAQGVAAMLCGTYKTKT